MYVPRLRRIDTVLKEIKAADPNSVISVAEQAFHSDRVFKTLNGHRRIINYDQLEQEVISIINAKQPPN